MHNNNKNGNGNNYDVIACKDKQWLFVQESMETMRGSLSAQHMRCVLFFTISSTM